MTQKGALSERCDHCGRERPGYIADPHCPKEGAHVYCQWSRTIPHHPPTCETCRVYAWSERHGRVGFLVHGGKTHHPGCPLVVSLFLALELERLARDGETGAPRPDGPALLRRVAQELRDMQDGRT